MFAALRLNWMLVILIRSRKYVYNDIGETYHLQEDEAGACSNRSKTQYAKHD
jgi:hypothetical protein